jgi:hypothetical protein
VRISAQIQKVLHVVRQLLMVVAENTTAVNLEGTPQGVPFLLRAARRLFVTQRDHWIHLGSFQRRPHSGKDADSGKNEERREHHGL